MMGRRQHCRVFTLLFDRNSAACLLQMRGSKFMSHVLLTSYEILMSGHDMPLLSSIPWHYLIVDEGHRLKNGSCKLNACLRQYSTKHRILLTGGAWSDASYHCTLHQPRT